jgi:hypothetical protein
VAAIDNPTADAGEFDFLLLLAKNGGLSEKP